MGGQLRLRAAEKAAAADESKLDYARGLALFPFRSNFIAGQHRHRYALMLQQGSRGIFNFPCIPGGERQQERGGSQLAGEQRTGNRFFRKTLLVVTTACFPYLKSLIEQTSKESPRR